MAYAISHRGALARLTVLYTGGCHAAAMSAFDRARGALSADQDLYFEIDGAMVASAHANRAGAVDDFVFQAAVRYGFPGAI